MMQGLNLWPKSQDPQPLPLELSPGGAVTIFDNTDAIACKFISWDSIGKETNDVYADE